MVFYVYLSESKTKARMTENELIPIVPELRQIALHISHGYTADSHTAEDMAQDTMLKLWAIRESICSVNHARGLAGSIAKHLCIDQHRKQRESPFDTLPTSKAEPLYAPPDVQMENSENEQWLQKKLSQLPTTQYQVLHLRQVEKKSMDEIAHIVGITPGSAATLLARARQRMLQEIKKRNNPYK